jgi:hypothetical protein
VGFPTVGWGCCFYGCCKIWNFKSGKEVSFLSGVPFLSFGISEVKYLKVRVCLHPFLKNWFLDIFAKKIGGSDWRMFLKIVNQIFFLL